jgi:hypothetical protein
MLPRHPDTYTNDELREWLWRLIAERTEEGPRLDYKQTQGLETPNEKREIARDATSFLNTYGGTILYGVPEERNAGGRPIPVSPYGMRPVESFGSRVENLLLDSVRPSIPELRIRELPSPDDDEKVVYLLWVPESSVGVHMVESYSDHRYWKRGQYRSVEMTERDVDERYQRLALARAWLDQFLASPKLHYLGQRVNEHHWSQFVVAPIRPLAGSALA